MAFIHASFQRRAYDIRTERRIKKNMLDNSIIMICAEERQEKNVVKEKIYVVTRTVQLDLGRSDLGNRPILSAPALPPEQ